MWSRWNCLVERRVRQKPTNWSVTCGENCAKSLITGQILGSTRKHTLCSDNFEISTDSRHRSHSWALWYSCSCSSSNVLGIGSWHLGQTTKCFAQCNSCTWKLIAAMSFWLKRIPTRNERFFVQCSGEWLSSEAEQFTESNLPVGTSFIFDVGF